MNELLTTPRTREIAALLLQGCDDQEISAELGMSRGTVKQHLRMIYLRAGISSGRKRVRLLGMLSKDGEGRRPLPALSEKEKCVAELVIEGFTNPEISVRCGLSVQVVKNYLRTVFNKCGVWTRTELAARFRVCSTVEEGN